MPTVRLYQDGRLISLSPGLNEQELREGRLLFEVQCSQGARVLFDDGPLAVVWTSDGSACYGQLDLTNQVGFHRFLVSSPRQPIAFDFRTITAKATHVEIELMARVVSGWFFSFKHQFVYSDATGRRCTVPQPEVAFGWLRDRLPELIDLVRAIDARPANETRQQFRTSHQARDVSIPRTLRLLRETPKLLEPMQGGPLEMSGQEYWPAAVVVRKRNREPARIEHMQLAYFLSRVAHLLANLREVVPDEQRKSILSWNAELRAIRSTQIIRHHDVPNAQVAWTPLPTHLQKTDQRYRRARKLHSEFLQDIDVSDYSLDSVRANVRDAWEIYQTFATHVVGRAFGLTYTSPRGNLRERRGDGASMHSDEYELYYDCRPPARVISSWRDDTERPAGERPDIVLRRVADGAVAVLDAKFMDHITGLL